jgi:DNA-binding transcriptional MerR regulator
MMRIGEFSRLSHLPVKTLRYYDELGLIKPAQVDQYSGYRYYEADQFRRLTRILALRDLGLSLEHIGLLLREGMSTQQMQAVLRERQAQAEERLAEEHGRLARLEAWLSHLEREEAMSTYEVVIKRVPAQKVVSTRGVVPQPSEQALLWARVMTFMEEKNLKMNGACIALYYDEEAPERDWDIEAAAPVESDVAVEGELRCYDLPAVETMASTVHEGPWVTVSEAYAALQEWTSANRYRVTGPLREVILKTATVEPDGMHVSQTDSGGVVEVQFPVEKV